MNFLPFFQKEERQLYAKIAIGQTAPIHFYEGLHDQVLKTIETIERDEETIVSSNLDNKAAVDDLDEVNDIHRRRKRNPIWLQSQNAKRH